MATAPEGLEHGLECACKRFTAEITSGVAEALSTSGATHGTAGRNAYRHFRRSNADPAPADS